MSAKLVPLRRVAGDTGELSDTALLAACGTGDAAALGALFDRFNQDVYRFAGRFPSVDAEGRDDLVQATFLEVWRTAHTFRGASSVRTWIFGIATNLARHTFRSERRRWARQAAYIAQPNDPSHAVDDAAAQRQLLAQVAEALTDLPEDLQLVFILCDLEQIPCDDVASIVDAPVGTVWRRLHHARKRLRTALEMEGAR